MRGELRRTPLVNSVFQNVALSTTGAAKILTQRGALNHNSRQPVSWRLSGLVRKSPLHAVDIAIAMAKLTTLLTFSGCGFPCRDCGLVCVRLSGKRSRARRKSHCLREFGPFWSLTWKPTKRVKDFAVNRRLTDAAGS